MFKVIGSDKRHRTISFITDDKGKFNQAYAYATSITWAGDVSEGVGDYTLHLKPNEDMELVELILLGMEE